MLFISHRGNLNGKNKDIENNPIYINEIIKLSIMLILQSWNRHNQLFNFKNYSILSSYPEFYS